MLPSFKTKAFYGPVPPPPQEEALPLEELMELSLTASFVREQTFVPVMMSRDDIDFIKLEVRC